MILHPDSPSDSLGGKANALAQLSSGPFRIPAWFAVSADDQHSDEEILHHARDLGCQLFAVRSSARDEDGAQHSFAGQYDSFLYVDIDSLLDKIRLVQQSHKSEHLQSYQSSQSISSNHAPTAIVQAMLDPDVSGVAFSADPITGRRDHALVSALWGTGSALVSGEADADTWKVDTAIIERTIANKAQQHRADSSSREGVSLVPVSEEMRRTACLSDADILAVADLARRCEAHFSCPQDIEWAIENGDLYLLQSRPITTLEHLPDPDAPLTVWDNSNIAESYSGITSPLTFSFAKRAYEHVYREFCKLLSVPQSRIDANDDVFPEMLGHIHGHVYYNLNSWYHVLAMLPGFTVNHGFMEQMMGVKEPMPDEIVEDILRQTQTSKAKDTLALVQTIFGLIKNHRGLPKQIEAFYQRLNTALATGDKALENMSGEQLAAHYVDLESQLLKRWDAPLINDFFAMIYYGVLKSLCEKWLGDASLQNSLLLDTGDIISAEPPRRIKVMAALAAPHDELCDTLADPHISSDNKLAVLSEHAELYQNYTEYLSDFGDRCLEELKLESPTVDDNPQSLLTSIGVMARRPISKEAAPSNYDVKEPVYESLTGIKKRLFLWVLRHAKDRVRDRENLRFERTRLFGRVRRIVVEIGKRLHSERHLDSPEDIFYLTITETIGAYRDGVDLSQLRELAESRKTEETSFTTPPPDRFETRGEPALYKHFTPTKKQAEEITGDLSGTGACPGIVRGTVRVVDDPRNATLQEGEILVAQQTDPGWVVLFPAASGLLVERGSLLSHSAIVARELQLPCVVSIPQVTKRLKTGNIVEMDGSTGTVTLLETDDNQHDEADR